jgi:branched-chain amino acid transport system substrate-binding protein
MRNLIARRVLSALPVAALAAAFVGTPGAGRAADPPIEIPVILPMTGPAAFIGKELADGTRVAEAHINRTGGVQGRQVRFVIEDDQTNPATSLQLTNGVVAKKAPVFFGSTLTALCNAQIPAIKDVATTMYCYSPSVHPAPGSNLFSAMFSTEDILTVELRYLKERGFRKIAILNGTDATGIDADKSLADIFKEPEFRDLSVVANEHFNFSELTVTAQLARIKTSGAQGIMSYVTGPALATILRGMTDGGLDIPIMSSPGNMSFNQMENYKAIVPKELLFAGPGLFAPDRIADPNIRQHVIEVLNQFRAAGIRPDNLHAIAWDVAEVTVGVLRKLGPNATAAQIRSGLAEVTAFYGGLGKYDFKAVPQRGLAQRDLIVVRWDRDKADFIGASKPGGRL